VHLVCIIDKRTVVNSTGNNNTSKSRASRICKIITFCCITLGRQGWKIFNLVGLSMLSGCPKSVGKQTGRQTEHCLLPIEIYTQCTHAPTGHAHFGLCCARLCAIKSFSSAFRRLLQMPRPQSVSERSSAESGYKFFVHVVKSIAYFPATGHAIYDYSW